jgi:hypothetical protein
MDIQRDDLMLVAQRFQVPGAKASLEKVRDAVQNWAEYATRAELDPSKRPWELTKSA